MKPFHSLFLAGSLLTAAAALSSELPLRPSSYLTSTNATALLSLHETLVSFNSVSGNEHAIGRWLTSFLESQNFTVEQQTIPPLPHYPHTFPRNNIFAYRGKSRRSRVLVTSHIDTVPPFYPYSVDSNGTIYGRGSVDAKASVAAQIAAVLDLISAAAISDDDASLLFVVSEEVDAAGMRAANDLGLKWESVVFGEPTELKLASGHKGALGLKLRAKGKAGHSGYPWLGENANSMLLPVLLALERLDLPSSEKYGNTTVNLGLVRGGVASNVIAEDAYAELQIRIAAGTAAEMKERLGRAVRELDERIEAEFTLGYGPIPCDTDLDGFEIMTVNYGTDIPWLEGKHKRYLYGPGSILVAHSDHESIKPGDLVEAVEGYKKIILGALGKGKGKGTDRVELEL